MENINEAKTKKRSREQVEAICKILCIEQPCSSDDGDSQGHPLKNYSTEHLWTEIGERVRKEISEKYPSNKDLLLLRAPELNQEVLNIIPEESIRCDSFLKKIQEQIACFVCGMRVNMNNFVDCEVDNNPLLAFSNQIEVHLKTQHNMMCAYRKSLIELHLDGGDGEVIKNGTTDGYLFGKDLAERLKSSRKTYVNTSAENQPQFETPTFRNLCEIAMEEASTSQSGLETLQEVETLALQQFPDIRTFIQRVYLEKNIPEQALNFVLDSRSNSTLLSYSSHLRKWWNFCISRNKNPYTYENIEIVEFLKNLGMDMGAAKSALAFCLVIGRDDQRDINNFIKQLSLS